MLPLAVVTGAGGPTHDLATVQQHVAARNWTATDRAFADAAALRLDSSDIADCVSALCADDFYKTMPSEKKKGAMQDVYRTTYQGMPIYLKLELSDKPVVISFKWDESR
jgi:hypothetical protein